ncbi:MAG: alpha/beta fold hydrolase [Dehalococcoidia bacterium]
MVATQERTVSVWRDSVRPRVRVAGSGPPLVFFHGAMGLQWDGFLDALAETHTVYAPEHPGTTPGDPDGVKPLDNLWDLVLYYYELFDGLGLEAPAVVGHSFGGMVAAEVASTNPARVSRLVLIDPIGLWRDDAPVKNWMVMQPQDLARAVFADPTGPVAQQALAMPEDPEAQIDARIQSMWSMACTGKFVWPIPDKGLKKRMHRIAAPTLILRGKQDGLIAPVYAQEFADRIPNARVELIDGAAHMPQMEQPDAVLRVVRAFLA